MQTAVKENKVDLQEKYIPAACVSAKAGGGSFA